MGTVPGYATDVLTDLRIAGQDVFEVCSVKDKQVTVGGCSDRGSAEPAEEEADLAKELSLSQSAKYGAFVFADDLNRSTIDKIELVQMTLCYHAVQ